MKQESTIRKVQVGDLPGLKHVIGTNDLFPPDMLDDMMADYFRNGASTDIWLTMEANKTPIAVCYCAPERLTEGTYNLYLIAIDKEKQGMGFGMLIMTYVEVLLKNNGARILLVETSGLPEFELTRKFYDKCGYTREAVIRDFYKEGEDKIVFWKML